MTVSQDQIVSLIQGAGVSADISGIKGDASLRQAGIDSLDMMNVLLAIEEKFAIKIPDDDIDALDSVENIVSYLRKRGA
jgi:acyl carrier protein